MAHLHLRLGAVLLLGACAGAPSPAPAPATLRVVCWNIRHGRGLDDRVDPGRIARELAALAPDVVCLQEVDVGVARSGQVDLPAVLAEALGMHAVFGKNIDHQGGDYGNAVLSRWPVRWQRNHHYRMLRPGEQRGLVVVGLDAAGRELVVMNTHLDHRPDDAERRANVAEILAAVARHAAAAVVVTGDFNDRPGSVVHGLLAGETAPLLDVFGGTGVGPGETFPAADPDRRIDWVLVPRDGVLVPVRGRVAPTAASDHRPLVVDLRWR